MNYKENMVCQDGRNAMFVKLHHSEYGKQMPRLVGGAQDRCFDHAGAYFAFQRCNGLVSLRVTLSSPAEELRLTESKFSMHQ